MEEGKDHTKKIGREKKEIEKLLESHRTEDESEEKSSFETATGLYRKKAPVKKLFCYYAATIHVLLYSSFVKK